MEINRLTDQQIAQTILNRDILVTKEFLYRKCHPLFNAIFCKYYTDCENTVELINDIYVFILIPNRNTQRSRLQDFSFRCSLTMWLKIVTENYCRQLYARRIPADENFDLAGDRNIISDDSLITDTHRFDMDDLQKLFSMMPNQRYRRLQHRHGNSTVTRHRRHHTRPRRRHV